MYVFPIIKANSSTTFEKLLIPGCKLIKWFVIKIKCRVNLHGRIAYVTLKYIFTTQSKNNAIIDFSLTNNFRTLHRYILYSCLSIKSNVMSLYWVWCSKYQTLICNFFYIFKRLNEILHIEYESDSSTTWMAQICLAK